MKAQAYVLETYNQPLVARDIEIPRLEPGQVLVKLLASGVCGSDVHMWRGEDSRLRLPMILGHEGIGIVADLGSPKNTVDGESIQVGDLILWNRGVSCGSCYYCKVLREPSYCFQRQVPGIHLALADPPFLNGCYANYLILKTGTDVFKAPSGIDPAVLVAASCSGATAAHGFDLVRPEPGDTVVVLGPGPLGLFAVALAKAYGASRIILSGGSAGRLNMGIAFGATTLLNRNQLSLDERQAQIKDITAGRGADIVVEASGSGTALQEAIGLARIGGTVLSIGLSQPGGIFPLDGFSDLTRKNLRLQGVWVSDTRHAFRAMQLVLNDPLPFAKMVTHRLPLSQINQALQAVENREAVKAVVLPE